jgi:hypothetical protein
MKENHTRNKRKPYFLRLIRYYFKCMIYLFIPAKEQPEYERKEK